MKVLSRILIILIVASMVGGAMYALVNINGSGGQQSSFQRPEGENNFRPNGEGGRDHERGNGSILGLGFGMLKNLVVVAIIAVVYLYGTKWFWKAKVAKEQIGT